MDTYPSTSHPYRGRLAPSPTGYLHLGHASTFRTAQERAVANGGVLVLRVEDLDGDRCRSEFREAIVEDLRWFGLRWVEGPDCSGPFAPYVQSERRLHYLTAWKQLRAAGLIYPCTCSRKDVLSSIGAPHQGDEEPLYPGRCRPAPGRVVAADAPAGMNWRFRVPVGEEITFCDGRLGIQKAVAGIDFGDFVVWRRDDIPAYQLAVTVDDAAMRITEVVRGEDLLTSTFRQILLYRALGVEPPVFYHCKLVTDENGRRLAKRHDSLSLRALRQSGIDPAR
ncbi:MAG: tRNA glutamyl-Q(34) synthetase GluQRS [Verrucomicrobiota bacterium]